MFLHEISIDSRTFSMARHLLEPIDKEHEGQTFLILQQQLEQAMCPLLHYNEIYI